jgi:hypothetical protein
MMMMLLLPPPPLLLLELLEPASPSVGSAGRLLSGATTIPRRSTSRVRWMELSVNSLKRSTELQAEGVPLRSRTTPRLPGQDQPPQGHVGPAPRRCHHPTWRRGDQRCVEVSMTLLAFLAPRWGAITARRSWPTRTRTRPCDHDARAVGEPRADADPRRGPRGRARVLRDALDPVQPARLGARAGQHHRVREQRRERDDHPVHAHLGGAVAAAGRRPDGVETRSRSRLVGIVGFEGSKIKSKHIYWDQASVLVRSACSRPRGCPSRARRARARWLTASRSRATRKK